MAPTPDWPDCIFYLDRTGPDQTETFYYQLDITQFWTIKKQSNNILQHANQDPILNVLTQFGNGRHGFHFNSILSSKFLEKIYDTLVKNTPTWTEQKALSPTRPENILKNVPWSQTSFGLVWSRETPGFGLPHRSLASGRQTPKNVKIWACFSQKIPKIFKLCTFCQNVQFIKWVRVWDINCTWAP